MQKKTPKRWFNPNGKLSKRKIFSRHFIDTIFKFTFIHNENAKQILG